MASWNTYLSQLDGRDIDDSFVLFEWNNFDYSWISIRVESGPTDFTSNGHNVWGGIKNKAGSNQGSFYFKVFDCRPFQISTKQYYIVSIDLLQHGLWSFQTGYIKLERFLPKNKHTQRKLSNFENWVSGEVSKSAKSPNLLTFKVNFLYQKLSESFSIFFHWIISI